MDRVNSVGHENLEERMDFKRSMRNGLFYLALGVGIFIAGYNDDRSTIADDIGYTLAGTLAFYLIKSKRT